MTGAKTRLANVLPGQNTRSPAAPRANGSICFIIRDPDPTPANRREYMVASDAALRME